MCQESCQRPKGIHTHSGYWGFLILQISELLPETCLRFPRWRVEGGGRNREPKWAAPGLQVHLSCCQTWRQAERAAWMAQPGWRSAWHPVLIKCSHKDPILDPSMPPSKPPPGAQEPLRTTAVLTHTIAHAGSPSLRHPFSCFSILPPRLKVQVQIPLPSP